MKKFINIITNLFLIPIILFAFSVLYAFLYLFEKKPIIIKQERVGKDNRIFEMYKFRTMKFGCQDKSSTKINDPRVTKIGKILRKHYLDEIPQVLNVLRREMNLIGPRPERPIFVDKFVREIKDYNKRHEVKPGITGWQQVNLSYGFEETKQKQKYDLFYIKNKGISFDLKIILRTILWILEGKGRY